MAVLKKTHASDCEWIKIIPAGTFQLLDMIDRNLMAIRSLLGSQTFENAHADVFVEMNDNSPNMVAAKPEVL